MASIRLQNQGKSSITFGKSKEEVLHPNGVGVFNTKTAKLLLRLYPNTLVDIDNIKADFDQKAVKDFTAKKPAAAAKKPEPDEDDEEEEDATDDDSLADALKKEKK